MRIFSAMVSSNRMMSWSTTATEPVKTLLWISEMGRPSKRISPLQG